MTSTSKLDALEAFGLKIIENRNRQDALSAIAQVMQSPMQGFANALSEYIWTRRVPTSLQQAHSLVDAMDAYLAMVCERATVLCRKCNTLFKPSEYPGHYNNCPWICGICGHASPNDNAHQHHIWDCANGRTPGYEIPRFS